MLPSWTPDIESLELLVSVAELGSLGKAAAAHGITQPSASVRLSRLERRLELPLLVRTPRGTHLTPTGETVVTWALGLLDSVRVLTDSVAALRSEQSAWLRISASLTVAEYLLPGWLIKMRADEPPVQASVTVTNSQHVFDDVRDGRVDLGLVESPSLPTDLMARRLGFDQVVLVAAPWHELALTPGPHTPHDLLTFPLLLREPGSGTRETFARAVGMIVGQSAVEFPHSTDLGSTATLLATARAGGGVAVVSMRAAHADLATGTLRQLNISQISLRRGLHAVWRGPSPIRAASRLIAIAREHLGSERKHEFDDSHNA